MSDSTSNKIAKKTTFQVDDTTFGPLMIENVDFKAGVIEDYLFKYLLREDNLQYIFMEKELTDDKLAQMLDCFIPYGRMESPTKEEIISWRSRHKSFYSFLAEGLLPLVYRDVKGWQLRHAVIDLCATGVDQHNGVDACLYDCEKRLFVLGEAKFYENFEKGVKEIINDFQNKSFLNKLDSFRVHAKNSCVAIRQHGSDYADVLSLDAFVRKGCHLAGFVLHELGEKKTENDYLDDQTYECFKCNKNAIVEKAKENSQKDLPFELQLKIESITIFNFFISSKNELIRKCIAEAIKKRNEIDV